MLNLLILFVTFLTITLFAFLVIPYIIEYYRRYATERAKRTTDQLDEMFIQANSKKIFMFLGALPLALGVIAFAVTQNFLVVLAAVVIGIILPSFVIKAMEKARVMKFKAQILDTLMVIASSLKAGLTLIQALEILVEETSAPVQEEFGLVVKENRMGASLADSISRLAKRMQSEEMDMLVNSISFAHQTGGNLAELIEKLTVTIREKSKLEQMVLSLTLQGKLQGRIMSILPIIFAIAITSMNKDYFQTMLSTDKGRMLLMVAAGLEVFGLFLISKLSKVEV